jgi:hypothetical protein
VLFTILVKASGSEYKSLRYFSGAAAAAAAAIIVAPRGRAVPFELKQRAAGPLMLLLHTRSTSSPDDDAAYDDLANLQQQPTSKLDFLLTLKTVLIFCDKPYFGLQLIPLSHTRPGPMPTECAMSSASCLSWLIL